MVCVALLSCVCLQGVARTFASPAPTLDEITALAQREREDVLATIRNSRDGEATLLALETQAGLAADARRDEDRPPLFPGCLRADELEIAAQLSLARAALNGKAYRVMAVEYRRLTTRLSLALAEANSSGNWKKRFEHVGHWIDNWQKARDPVTRELLRRTVVDQAIRASLSAFEGAKIYGKTRASPALRSYDAYVFNLMCTADENNLIWLKEQLGQIGWFDIGRFGWAADQAASLLVQHADGDAKYQATIAALLESKLATGDTNPENFAYLVDRVAARAGRPQRFATHVECVDGQWMAPKIEQPETLDSRRAKMGLGPYLEQLARGKHLCQPRAL